MDQKNGVRFEAREYANICRRIGLNTELFSYLFASPALIVYGIVGFIKGGDKLAPFLISTGITVSITYSLGLLLRQLFLSPYIAWLRAGKKPGTAEAEAARRALLALPLREAVSIFFRWLAVAPLILLFGQFFGVEYGVPYAIFSIISCFINGIADMPILFLGSELAVSTLLNSPGLAEAKAKPRVRFGLRLRIACGVDVVVLYLSITALIQMYYLRKGFIDMDSSILCLFLLVIGANGMIFLILRLIAQSLSSTVKTINGKLEAMNRDSGDLTTRLDIIAQDDIGTLSENFNGLMGFLRTSISSVKVSSAQGSTIGTELASTAEESSAAATQMAASMEGLRKRTEGLRSSAADQQEALAAADSALKSFLSKVDDQASAVEESSAAIEQLIANLNSIESATKGKRELVKALKADGAEGDRIVGGITEAVAEIDRSTENIMALVDVISDVSRSTNLLAMNAAIEAAHAGSSGRGFAVVADEIRKLAESTDRNSKDIAKSLGGVVEKIKRSAELSNRTKEVFKKILEGIAVVDGGMEETLSGLTEASTGSGQIVDAVSELSTLTVGIRDTGHDIGERIRLTLEKANQVAQLSGENEQSSQEISSGLSEIAQAASSLSSLGLRNSENIARLDVEVARFKLE
jgi:methyl-accepting chemotaxis protein